MNLYLNGVMLVNVEHGYRSGNRTVLETIILGQCSERWSCWTLEHSVQHDHTSLQWSRL